MKAMHLSLPLVVLAVAASSLALPMASPQVPAPPTPPAAPVPAAVRLPLFSSYLTAVLLIVSAAGSSVAANTSCWSASCTASRSSCSPGSSSYPVSSSPAQPGRTSHSTTHYG